MSLFFLQDDAWLPVRRASGVRVRIRPAEIVTGIEDDPIVAFAWPRADLDAGAREFLIGLLSTTCWRQTVDDWEHWWAEPPDAATLDACFAPFRHAFVLDGPGARFLQDRAELDGERMPVGALLIDTPGANALKKNTDLLVKRGRVELLSRAAAAMGLFTLNAYAPAGGAGIRTSLRGGGPLTTLLLPGAGENVREPGLRVDAVQLYWCGARDQGDVWFIDKPAKNDLHPTMKPVALVERAVRNSSKSRDIVLDPFGGSGSTLIACEKAGRQARLVELDPKYCDVIVQRWQVWAGGTAVLEGDGRSFEEIAKEH